ncbi:hypothetical protein Gotur_014013 [Gossypium turneri]
MVKTRNFVEGDSTLAIRAVWDDELTLIFCELCMNEVNADNRLTTHLNSKGWENVGYIKKGIEVMEGVA